MFLSVLLGKNDLYVFVCLFYVSFSGRLEYPMDILEYPYPTGVLEYPMDMEL